jgi:hypothetical protein
VTRCSLPPCRCPDPCSNPCSNQGIECVWVCLCLCVWVWVWVRVSVWVCVCVCLCVRVCVLCVCRCSSQCRYPDPCSDQCSHPSTGVPISAQMLRPVCVVWVCVSVSVCVGVGQCVCVSVCVSVCLCVLCLLCVLCVLCVCGVCVGVRVGVYVCLCVLRVHMSMHPALYDCQDVQHTGKQHRCKILGWVFCCVVDLNYTSGNTTTAVTLLQVNVNWLCRRAKCADPHKHLLHKHLLVSISSQGPLSQAPPCEHRLASASL